jgi:hypothetical protein
MKKTSKEANPSMNKIWRIVFFLICLVTGYSTHAASGTQAPNLLNNPGFEQEDVPPGQAPDDWLFLGENDSAVNGGLLNSGARTGRVAVFLGQPESDDVTWEVFVISMPVTAGAHYQFSAWVKPDDAEPLKYDVMGSISIEWKDANGTELGRVTGSRWNPKTVDPSQGWTQVSASGDAPANAASASFVITYHAGIVVGSGGKFLIDDAAITETLR